METKILLFKKFEGTVNMLRGISQSSNLMSHFENLCLHIKMPVKASKFILKNSFCFTNTNPLYFSFFDISLEER